MRHASKDAVTTRKGIRAKRERRVFKAFLDARNTTSSNANVYADSLLRIPSVIDISATQSQAVPPSLLQKRIKDASPRRTKKAASKSARPASHTTASGRVAWMANRAAANAAPNRENPSIRATTNTKIEFAACIANSVQCQCIGFVPAQLYATLM